jgi:hypothetical protein
MRCLDFLFADSALTRSCSFGRAPARKPQVDYIRYLEQKVVRLSRALGERNALEDHNSLDDSTYQSHGADESSEKSMDHIARSDRTSQTTLYDERVSTGISPRDDFTTHTRLGAKLFHGRFGGLAHLRLIRNKCSELACTSQSAAGCTLVRAFDSPSVPLAEKVRGLVPILLPPIADARKLSYQAMNEGLTCHECLDRDDYDLQLTRIYGGGTGFTRDPSSENREFLALVLAILAMGYHREGDVLTVSLMGSMESMDGPPQKRLANITRVEPGTSVMHS